MHRKQTEKVGCKIWLSYDTLLHAVAVTSYVCKGTFLQCLYSKPFHHYSAETDETTSAKVVSMKSTVPSFTSGKKINICLLYYMKRPHIRTSCLTHN